MRGYNGEPLSHILPASAVGDHLVPNGYGEVSPKLRFMLIRREQRRNFFFILHELELLRHNATTSGGGQCSGQFTFYYS